MTILVFEWDPEKERENERDNGVNFTDASEIFFDYFRKERYYDNSSGEENRRQTMGFYKDKLLVVYSERGNVTHIISARVAEPSEQMIYYGDGETHGWRRVNPEVKKGSTR